MEKLFRKILHELSRNLSLNFLLHLIKFDVNWTFIDEKIVSYLLDNRTKQLSIPIVLRS
jgi:hypothetical protein